MVWLTYPMNQLTVNKQYSHSFTLMGSDVFVANMWNCKTRTNKPNCTMDLLKSPCVVKIINRILKRNMYTMLINLKKFLAKTMDNF